MQLCVLDLGEHGFAGRHRDLELDRALRLPLKDDRTGGDAIDAADITHPQLHQVAGSQFAVDRQIEKGKIPNLLLQLQPNRMGHMLQSLRGAFWPVSLSLFQSRRR